MTQPYRRLQFESLEHRLVLASIAELLENPPADPPTLASLSTAAVVSTSSTINAGPLSNVIVMRRAANQVDVDIWIDGVLTNKYPLFDSAPLIINGGGGNDFLVVDYENDHPIPTSGLTFNGGNQPEDMVMVTYELYRLRQFMSGPQSGSLELSTLKCGTRICDEPTSTVNYTGVAATLITARVSFLGLNLTNGPNRDVVLGDDTLGLTDFSQIYGPTVGTSYFKNPTFGLEVTLGNLGDSISVLPLDAELRVKHIDIHGGAAADLITGGSGKETIEGGGGHDVIYGNGGDDTLAGGPGNDSLVGGNGDDNYEIDADSPGGIDTLIEHAGGGTDTVSFASTTSVPITFQLGVATPQTINANISVDLNSASTFEDLIGGDKDDLLIGNALANKLFDYHGNNRYIGAAGDDELVGGNGNDTYIFDTDAQLGTDRISDLGGDDSLDFSATSTRSVVVNLSGEVVQTQVVNAGLSLKMYGGAIEIVQGGSLGDTIIGSSYPNILSGNGGNDSLRGGPGDDTYAFAADLPSGTDTLIEFANEGTDTLDFSWTTNRSITVNLGNASPQIVNEQLSIDLNLDSTFEQVVGGFQADVIIGNKLRNILRGGSGADVIITGGGPDTIFGGSGDDLLIAGTTSYDFNRNSLLIILTAWSDSTKAYGTRIANLRAGIQGVRLKVTGADATVKKDPIYRGNLVGEAGRDWFFAAIGDGKNDREATEVLEVLP